MLESFVSRSADKLWRTEKEVEAGLETLRKRYGKLLRAVNVNPAFFKAGVQPSELLLVRAVPFTGEESQILDFLIAKGKNVSDERDTHTYETVIGPYPFFQRAGGASTRIMTFDAGEVNLNVPLVKQKLVKTASLWERLRGEKDEVRADLDGWATINNLRRVPGNHFADSEAILATWSDTGKYPFGGISEDTSEITEVFMGRVTAIDLLSTATYLDLAMDGGLDPVELYDPENMTGSYPVRGPKFFPTEGIMKAGKIMSVAEGLLEPFSKALGR